VALQPIDALTVKDHALAAIYDAILTGKLQPGEHIVEARLARELRVGTTPVREALFELESRGFVSRIANRGTFVTQLSLEDAEQIFRIRSELEGLVAGLLEERIAPGDLDLLHRHAKDMRSAAARGDLAAFYRSDLEFHRAMWRLSGNRFLVRCLEQLVPPLFAFFIMRNPDCSEDDLNASVDRHIDVIQAMAARACARKCMENSMQFFWRQQQQLMFGGGTGPSIP
jgi:DNA-binding GntR family transcriptional regulator